MIQHEPLLILLADDDEDDRLFFKEAFDEIKIKTRVETVNDGVELMKYLNSKDVVLPHILFLDLNMPLKSGLECLKEIRESKNLKDLSVAIYSTSGSEEDIEKTFIKGANVYIKKPNDFSTLKKVLSEVISINWQYHTSGLNKENFLLSI
jgi:CheY-like chemotaxis protein